MRDSEDAIQYGDLPSDPDTEAMVDALRAACAAGGLSPEDVALPGPGVITLGDTGVTCVLVVAASIRFWHVRETYRVRNPDGTWRRVSSEARSVPAREWARAAKCSLLLAAERRIDVLLSRHAGVVP